MEAYKNSRIYAYQLPASNSIGEVHMPIGAQLIAVGTRGSDPVARIWCLVPDITEPTRPRKFLVIGTGIPFPVGAWPDRLELDYIGSYDEGIYVWHVFEVLPQMKKAEK